MYLFQKVLHKLYYTVFLSLDKRPDLYYTLRVNLRGEVKILTGGQAREHHFMQSMMLVQIWYIPKPMVQSR